MKLIDSNESQSTDSLFINGQDKLNSNETPKLLKSPSVSTIHQLSQQFFEPTSFKTPIAHIQISPKNESFYLYKRRIIVGRKSKYLNQCDIIIEQSNFISRMHFSIELNENIKKFFLYCMSKNGIFVNNKYVQRGVPFILDDRCTLRFPNTTIKLYFESYLANYSGEIEIDEEQAVRERTLSSKSLVKKQISKDIENSNDTFREQNDSNFDGLNMNNDEYEDEDDENDDEDDSDDNPHRKPSYSYAQLISQAIASSNERQLTLNQIYTFIANKYPYYKINDKGWQNSIRHNLSLNRYFLKVARQTNEPGKGSFWRIDPKCESKVIEQAYHRKRSRSLTNTNRNKNNSDKVSEPNSPISIITKDNGIINHDLPNSLSPEHDSNSSSINNAYSPINTQNEKFLQDSKLSQLTPASPESENSNTVKSNGSVEDYVQPRLQPQQKLIKLLKPDSTGKKSSETILGYLYQIAAKQNEDGQQHNTKQISYLVNNQQSPQKIIEKTESKNNNNNNNSNSSTYVLQYNLSTLANLVPTTPASAISNLSVLPVNDINLKNLNTQTNNNAIKIRKLLNSNETTSNLKRSSSDDNLNINKRGKLDEDENNNNIDDSAGEPNKIS